MTEAGLAADESVNILFHTNFITEKCVMFFLQRDSLSLSSNLDDMNPMMLNDNNEDLIPDDNMLPEELRVPSKPLLWQMEIPDRADNTGNMDMIKYGYNNLNKNNVSTQPCRNSIQVSTCLKYLVYFVYLGITIYMLFYNICCFIREKV